MGRLARMLAQDSPVEMDRCAVLAIGVLIAAACLAVGIGFAYAGVWPVVGVYLLLGAVNLLATWRELRRGRS